MTQVKRSEGKSVVAAAAYRAGENLFSEYYGEHNDYTYKGGVKYLEIMLPDFVPDEYHDRQTLWNAVEKVEKHPEAQLAYSFDIALQNELTEEENLSLAREFLQKHFVERGMIVDFAMHDPDREEGIPNPHFHFLCPIRPMEETGRWGMKQRRVYVLDEGGNRIRDTDGKEVFNAVPTTDWGKPETLDFWREQWAVMVNAKFEEKGLDCRIDNRTLEAQGLDELPTVHEGPTVRAMEKKGIRTEKGDMNRLIRATNALTRKLKAAISAIREMLSELRAEAKEKKALTVMEVLSEHYGERNAVANTFAYGRDKAKVGNLKKLSNQRNYLLSKGIVTIDDLDAYLSSVEHKQHSMNDGMRKKATHIKELNELLRNADNYERYKPVSDELNKIRWKGKREDYQREHDSELTMFYMAQRLLKKNLTKDGKIPKKSWQAERDRLQSEYAADKDEYGKLWADLKELRPISQIVYEHRHKQEREQTKTRANERD